VHGLSIKINDLRASQEPSSDIYVVEDTNGADDGVKALFGLMQEHGIRLYKGSESEGLVYQDSVVIVKVNSQWNQRGGTNTDLVKSIITEIVGHPNGFTGEVVIADNGQAQYGSSRRGGSLNYAENNAVDPAQSIQKVADSFTEYNVSTYLWDDITTTRVEEYENGDSKDGYIIQDEADPETGIRVSYPKFRTKNGAMISFRKGVWDPDEEVYDSERLVVFNVPVFKAHFIYGVTACMKHYMGVVSDKLQGGGAHRSVRNGGMGTMMAETRMPDLNILDGIFVNASCGSGPSCSYDDASNLNLVMASVDPVALDCWATENVLMEAAKMQGITDLGKFDPYSRVSGSHGEWMKKSLDQMQRAGLQVTDDRDRMNVYVTKT